MTTAKSVCVVLAKLAGITLGAGGKDGAHLAVDGVHAVDVELDRPDLGEIGPAAAAGAEAAPGDENVLAGQAVTRIGDGDGGEGPVGGVGVDLQHHVAVVVVAPEGNLDAGAGALGW